MKRERICAISSFSLSLSFSFLGTYFYKKLILVEDKIYSITRVSQILCCINLKYKLIFSLLQFLWFMVLFYKNINKKRT